MACIGMAVVDSPSACAQSNITLYGWTDAGIEYLSNADGKHSAVRLQNYGILPSEFGLTGTEDLGGGLKALFTLQQGFNLNDGTSTVPGYAFFRGAYVGLSGSFGTVTLGRQFSVLFDKTLFYDPFLYASYSGQGVLIPLEGNFIDNAIKYKSPVVAGFNGEALVSTSGIAGNTRAGRVLEAGGEYVGASLGVSAVYHQQHGTVAAGVDMSAQQTTIGTLAVRYAFDPVTVYLGGERQTGDLEPVKTVYWAGARYQITAAVALAGGVWHTQSHVASVGHPTLFVLSTTYAFSRRTTVYLNLGYARNSGSSSQTVYEYDPTPLNGASQRGAMLGISHVF
nr:porin [Paraburkholderia ribeironis]